MAESTRTAEPDRSDSPPRVHHVAFAVAPERLSTTAQFFVDLGFTFDTIELADVGLRVLLDWTRGIELVSPDGAENGSVADFLDRNGDGVYSVVLRVPEASAAEHVARRYGAHTHLRQHRDVGGFGLDEIELAVRGLPLTFLSTDLP